jgi:hypothetical protein
MSSAVSSGETGDQIDNTSNEGSTNNEGSSANEDSTNNEDMRSAESTDVDDVSIESLRIKNKTDFEHIIMAYGRYAFGAMETPVELLEFIINKIVPFTDELYDDKFGADTVMEFMKMLSETVGVDDLSKINRGKIIVRGTFGNIYDSTEGNDTCYKACRVDSHHLRKIRVRPPDRGTIQTDDRDEIFFSGNYESGRFSAVQEFMYEITNYIIWRSLMLYIKDLTFGETGYPDLSKNIAIIQRIYYIEEEKTLINKSIRSPVSPSYSVRFRIGYEMDRLYGDVSSVFGGMVNRINHYENLRKTTLCEINELANTSHAVEDEETKLIEVVKDCSKKIESKKRIVLNIFRKTYDMFDEFRFYDQFGITLIHRDSSTKNVMIYDADDMKHTNTRVKFVDFSALKTQIKFEDGEELTIGHFFHAESNRNPFRYYDHVLFLIFAHTYRKNALIKLGIINEIDSILKFNIYGKMIKLTDPTSVWLYPYGVVFDEKDFASSIKNLFEFK